ncbi:MAG: prepilin-type N-terminal cleavage/methylation domain-containing protein [Desulfobia sp.]
MLQKNHSKKAAHLKDQQGFTLIEIIAVLIILGLLAAVAIPKFTGLTEKARNKAVEGALSAGMSQASMTYSRLLLENDGSAISGDQLEEALNNNPPDNEDFVYTFDAAPVAGEGGNVTITVNGKSGSPYADAEEASRVFDIPQ